MMSYRREDKYLINNIDRKSVECRIKHFMSIDDNSKDNFSYNVRSVYFDDYNNSCFFANRDGLDKRFKVRIRIYNKSDKLIKLEVKYKENGYTKKDFCLISKELCFKMIRGDLLTINECNHNKVLNKVYLEQHLHRLVPKVIVEYDRVAYVSRIGNTRITFDSNIKVSKKVEQFFYDNISSIPLLEEKIDVMEIKYDKIIPRFILESMELGKMNNSSFSKYYLSRLKFMEEVL